jgi:ectoine hydroxylase-related dioxygenase (phytanoyl-CoA dioxygenase family)
VRPAAQLAQAVTGSNAMHIFYDQLFVKEPGTRTATPWHTDHSYWQLRGGAVCSLWLPLDTVPGATAVRYAAGSHKWGLKHQIKSFSGDADRYAASAALPSLPDIDAMEAAGEVRVLRWDVEPGDVIIFDSFTVHGAPGNSSASVRRRAYATRWASDATRFDARPGTMHYTWVRCGARVAGGVRCMLACARPPPVGLLRSAALALTRPLRAQKEKAQLDCGLADGAPLECAMHPAIPTKL